MRRVVVPLHSTTKGNRVTLGPATLIGASLDLLGEAVETIRRKNTAAAIAAYLEYVVKPRR